VTREAVIAAAAESPYTRHPGPGVTTETLLADALLRVLDRAGIERDAVDGLGVASFTLRPDHAIDLAWRLGLRLRWLTEDTTGGASGINMLQHALRAVEAGDAETVVLLAGDRLLREEFAELVDGYNRATRDHLAPIPFLGPNTQFAFVTRRHMAAHGLRSEDYGHLAVAQRRWAAGNPGAVYREPLTLEEYLEAPVVADPLRRYDCVPVVSGADAIVVTTRDRAPRGVRIRALRGLHNADGQESDGLRTGLAELAAELWDAAGAGPEEIDVASVYDDYPVMVYVQLADLGFVPDGDVAAFVRGRVAPGDWPLNTSGGQLSAGQAGAAGGMHGLVEAVTQLAGEAGTRQVAGARLALVSGYGMVLYRHGACANAAVLEAAG
jgi:acetyl-CoA acetyltransferase